MEVIEKSATTEAILESISDGVFTVDRNWNIVYFNRAAESITGIQRTEALAKPCSEVFRSSMCENGCPLRQTMDSGIPIINRAGFIVDTQGNRIPVSVSTAVLRNSDGEIVGGAETFRDLSEMEALRREITGRQRVGDMVSRSPAMRRIFDFLPVVASSGSTFLIGGETGTGKELLARAVHDISPFSAEPFVSVNCGALPDNLLESELFGYRKGAFTGAWQNKPGRFSLAGKGTLFLDEIGEISQAMQVQLLRVLQERKFEPLGSTSSELFSGRIMAATHRNLEQMVAEGQFRQDLYYRINVVRLEIPPLRNRLEDIPILVEHFIHRFNTLQARNIEGITPDCLDMLLTHHWPGNIRELENVVERAFVTCRHGLIGIEHIGPLQFISGHSYSEGKSHFSRTEAARVTQNAPAGVKTSAAARATDTGQDTGQDKDIATVLAADQAADNGMSSAVARAQTEAILHALASNGNSRVRAAAALGIHKTTLHRKMRALDIKAPR
ncbi:MAG: Fis family transcriptional regulator [Candidatus Wallbacteria bacterium HGW-Wallbacteria-1]|jgi:PAS domain S-box-containing protein|uniref:Fis family transcriptional regulator n=1 Tax=Candidatus Wallbacteria bacterium HGW-Wallbacteria-1 TaxID=2013854 RepID=A0A2N1PL70_9BACT|nr:MAG: Fis family transcriptional regulator [Candidatus Wallbacteria bacterium HGW-Wallbacteria-1]